MTTAATAAGAESVADSEDLQAQQLEELHNRRDFAMTTRFLSLYYSAFGQGGFQTEKFEQELISDKGSEYIAVLCTNMLRVYRQKKGIGLDNWQKELKSLLLETNPDNCPFKHDSDQPSSSSEVAVESSNNESIKSEQTTDTNPSDSSNSSDSASFWKLNVVDRLTCVAMLCNLQCERSGNFTNRVKGNVSATEWRSEPIGIDSQQRRYWCFDDLRLYRETLPGDANKKSTSSVGRAPPRSNKKTITIGIAPPVSTQATAQAVASANGSATPQAAQTTTPETQDATPTANSAETPAKESGSNNVSANGTNGTAEAAAAATPVKKSPKTSASTPAPRPESTRKSLRQSTLTPKSFNENKMFDDHLKEQRKLLEQQLEKETPLDGHLESDGTRWEALITDVYEWTVVNIVQLICGKTSSNSRKGPSGENENALINKLRDEIVPRAIKVNKEREKRLQQEEMMKIRKRSTRIAMIESKKMEEKREIEERKRIERIVDIIENEEKNKQQPRKSREERVLQRQAVKEEEWVQRKIDEQQQEHEQEQNEQEDSGEDKEFTLNPRHSSSLPQDKDSGAGLELNLKRQRSDDDQPNEAEESSDAQDAKRQRIDA
ncbi:hypothetical protein GQ42DRAFT_161271 [Ramicandelaber brevisporus]|nr:hypothetical protein GQ42DRAFT_161271 [Ramicandelaber brevisporus]